MKLIEIKKIEEILSVGKPLLRHQIIDLTAPTENGGNLLINVQLRLKNEKNFEEKFEVVAKLVAPTLELQRTESFKNEIAFYTSIISLLQDFLKLQGVETLEVFPTYYGGRLTLNSKVKEADRDAVFFLENLVASGYRNFEPQVGFDLKTTKTVLKELAKFHASFLAVKLKKPEIFKHKIKPYINTNDESENVTINDTKAVVSLMWENEACVSLIPRIRRAMLIGKSSTREPFATIVHGEFWTRNIMVMQNCDQKIKIVDFQKFTYGSPAADLVFFLFTSVETAVLEDNFEEITSYYYENFISTLENTECELIPYSLGEFLKEVYIEAKFQFPRVLIQLNTVFTSKYTEEHKKRGWYIVQEFARRNWI